MDVDWSHRSWPPGADDPENVLVEAENMGNVWSNYSGVGPRQPVVAGVIVCGHDQERYEKTVALPTRSVRLVASAGVADSRLRRRYTDDQTGAAPALAP